MDALHVNFKAFDLQLYVNNVDVVTGFTTKKCKFIVKDWSSKVITNCTETVTLKPLKMFTFLRQR